MSFTTEKILRFTCCVFLATALYGATGKVVYSGGAVGTAGAYGSTLSQVFDRDVTTVWYGANPNGAWAGTDFGASTPVQLTAYRIGNAIIGSSGQKNELAGGVIQASNDCSFAAGVVTLDTIPNPAPGVAYLARYTMAARNERAISPTSAYRCYRYVSAPNGYGGVSELQWIGSAGASGLSARPVMPVLSPGSGTFPNGSATVSITSQTASASIYYTTDGSTPTNSHGTLYSEPFSLAVGPATVLQAVAYDATLSTPLSDVVTGNFRNYAFKPNDNWYDDDGILIEAHSADVSGPFNGKYYMVGQFSNKGNSTNDIPGNEGIWMYSSSDLLNWHWEGQILDTGASAGTAWRYVERPHILHNAANNNYVLWAHMDNNHDSTDRAGVATASNPTGPWTWQTVTLNPDNNGFKDFSLFEDVNGTAYVAYVTQCGGCGAQGTTTISKLTDQLPGQFRVFSYRTDQRARGAGVAATKRCVLFDFERRRLLRLRQHRLCLKVHRVLLVFFSAGCLGWRSGRQSLCGDAGSEQPLQRPEQFDPGGSGASGCISPPNRLLEPYLAVQFQTNVDTPGLSYRNDHSGEYSGVIRPHSVAILTTVVSNAIAGR